MLLGGGSAMPGVVRTYWECYGREPARENRIMPSPAQLSAVDQALGWFMWLDQVNLQVLCHPCHSRKTATEDTRWG